MFFGENEYSRTELRECMPVSEGIETVSIDCCVVFLQPEESRFWVSGLMDQAFPTHKHEDVPEVLG
jgi:hypothetical protein